MKRATSVGFLSLLVGSLAWQPIQVHATEGVATSITGSATASRGSVEGIDLSLAGSVMAVDAIAHASVDVTKVSLQAIEASVNLGTDLIIVSVRFVEDVAYIVLTAFGAGVEAMAGSVDGAHTFTVAMSRAALEAALAGSDAVLNAASNGEGVRVTADRLTAGSSGRVIGYRIALAETPDTVVTMIFNETGRQLYAAQLN